MSRALGYGLLCGILFVPATAYASCRSVTSCFCDAAGAIIEARISAIDGARSSIEVLATHSNVDAGAPGLDAVPRAEGDVVGRRLLVFTNSEGGLQKRLEVDEGGEVACVYTDFRMPAGEVITVAFDSDCQQILYSHGLREPPCNDTRSGCSSVPDSSALAALLLGAVFFAIRRRR
ncbi:MAG: hypothetical protein ACYC8T_27575 [Myxococcaceae bacterium]